MVTARSIDSVSRDGAGLEPTVGLQHAGCRMKLLVVEDDRMLSELIRRSLREDGFTVDVASDGEQAETLVFVNDYDGIVLDLVLPRKSGLEVLQQMRREGRSTPTLILTGRRAKHDVVRGLDIGADDYLTKPFDLDELKARVRALVRRGGARQNEQLAFGGVVLDRRRRQASAEGQQLRMTPKEFALLEYLIARSNEVVTRTELLDKVWDLHFDPGSNVVDVHVARLRAKLRLTNARVRLDTVRGIGFVLAARDGEDQESA
jgi:DNA-binding response OmpR family regulator